MRPIIFCGYHHSGKTTLLVRAAAALAERGHTVSVVKHAAASLDPADAGKDTVRYAGSGARIVVVLTRTETLRFGSGGGGAARESAPPNTRLEERLDAVLGSLDTDFALVEGFKGYTGPVPRIVFGRSAREIETLRDDLTIGYSGVGIRDLGIEGLPFVPLDIPPGRLADLIERKTVKLTRLRDCSRCGFPSCREFLALVLRGELGPEACGPSRDEP